MEIQDWSGEDFKAWRERMGWTQAEAGAQLGISDRTVQDKQRLDKLDRLTMLACMWLEDARRREIDEKLSNLAAVEDFPDTPAWQKALDRSVANLFGPANDPLSPAEGRAYADALARHGEERDPVIQVIAANIEAGGRIAQAIEAAIGAGHITVPGTLRVVDPAELVEEARLTKAADGTRLAPMPRRTIRGVNDGKGK